MLWGAAHPLRNFRICQTVLRRRLRAGREVLTRVPEAGSEVLPRE
ncbi:hypothetical protein HMPREF1616_01031 [Escherichia coli 908658]|nr:hypothetical protein HMPREF1616_01031 [Escherichia coli 908658]